MKRRDFLHKMGDWEPREYDLQEDIGETYIKGALAGQIGHMENLGEYL